MGRPGEQGAFTPRPRPPPGRASSPPSLRSGPASLTAKPRGGRRASRRLGAPSHKDRKCTPAAFRSRGLRNLRAPRPRLTGSQSAPRSLRSHRLPSQAARSPAERAGPRSRVLVRGRPAPEGRAPRSAASYPGLRRRRPPPAARTPALLAHLQSNRKVLRFSCDFSAFPVAPTKINAWVNGLNGK